MTFSRSMARVAALLFACFCAVSSFAARDNTQDPAQLVVHLLDYVGTDYAGAVEAGAIKSQDEYKEMQEFSAQVGERIALLPPNPSRADMSAEAERLASLVSARADARAVAEQASRLRWMLINAYQLKIAPNAAPELGGAATLYAQHCASCHGAEGRGNGPAARTLDPPPAIFQDRQRMASRSIYSLYNSISLGVSGTSMAPFKQLSENERWSLAFYIATLGIAPGQMKQGEALWRSAGQDDPAPKALPDLRALTTLSPKEIRSRFGESAALVQDYLLAHPDALEARKPDPVELARDKLGESLAAYERSDRTAALELAISAYLDGFELAESGLDNVDHDLRLELEREMIALRGVLGSGAPVNDVRERMHHVDVLLSRAQEKLSEEGLSQASAFASAAVILLREGLEAILLLAAIIAVVAKTGRREVMPWVHAGWIAAVLLGFLTWSAAQFLIHISGANREVTEGMTALVAAAMLLYVGFWLHGKSQSKAWSQFLHHQVGAALAKRTVWAMASVSFLAVYRELFEIVLFYQALWAQSGTGGHTAVLGGIGVAAAALAIAGWCIFKYSVRLPLGPFFRVMLWLVLLFAFAFAGDGVAKLQEAGTVSASPVPFLTIPVLGIHPTLQTLAAQFAVIALVAANYLATRHRTHLPRKQRMKGEGIA